MTADTPDTGAGTPLTMSAEEEAARAEVSERWSTRYRHAAVALRLALGSIRSLKLPDWLGQQVDTAWQDSAWLVDITAPPPLDATDPAGLDVERLTKAIRLSAYGVQVRTDYNRGTDPVSGPAQQTWDETTAERIAAEYARLADGPGPEERP